MDTIGKGPAILSTCVKRWRFFACKVGFLLQDRTKFGTAGLFRQTEHAKKNDFKGAMADTLELSTS